MSGKFSGRLTLGNAITFSAGINKIIY